MTYYRMINLTRKWLVSGLLVWIPIIVTIFAIKILVDLLSQSLLLLPAALQPDFIFGFHVPGIGVLLTLGVILLTGMFAANFAGRRVMRWSDSFVARIPIVRTIYTGVQQVTKTLFTPGGDSFRKVLLVEFPCPGVWSIAFQTGQGSKDVENVLNAEPMVTYFIPTTPNPTSGFLMMAPKSKVIELEMSVDQALKFVISLGVVQPAEQNNKVVNKITY